MKKSSIFTIMSFALIGVILFQSCKKDSTTETPQEFVANNSTFSSFMSWPIDATADGADPALGGAHAGNDSTVKRNIYFQNGQDRVNGVYPIGSLIVKHTQNPDKTVDEYTAMAKRGNNYSSTGGDWEFFVLNPDGSIADDGNGNALRGSTSLMNGMCLSCHTAASSKDYIFSKP